MMEENKRALIVFGVNESNLRRQRVQLESEFDPSCAPGSVYDAGN